MRKRLFDIVVASVVTLVSLPVVAGAALLIYLSDGHSPVYVARRVGKNGTIFRMLKLRSMVPNAEATGVDSTAADDPRLTRVGSLVRRTKIDELPQFWNVLLGDMSIVGPRPNVERETRLYTESERRLLTVSPGVTDLSSIVFSDYSEILRGSSDPDIAYNQTIRPWKSRLGLLYVGAKWSLWTDTSIVLITVISFVSRSRALTSANRIIGDLGADAVLRAVSTRQAPLPTAPPPGADSIVTFRS